MSKKKLTKTLVESVEPTHKNVIVWDSIVPGFHLKVTPQGRRVYMMYYRSKGGVQRRPKIAEHGVLTCEQARDRARELMGDVAAGKDPSGDVQRIRAASLTLKDVWDRHSRVAQWKPRTIQELTWRWNRHVGPELGSVRICEITTRDITRLHTRLRDSPTEANRCVQLIKLLLNVAIREEELAGSNPAVRVKPYKESSRETFLSGTQLVAIMEAIAEEEALGGTRSVVRAGESTGRGGKGLKEERSRGISTAAAGLFRLLIFTGARLSDISTAKWGWVDWGASALRLPDSKTGKKVVWLNELALAELRRLQDIRTQDEWIIEGRMAGRSLVNSGKPWRRVRRAAANILAESTGQRDSAVEVLETVRIHDLRHTFASFGVTSGVPIFLVGKTLGHSDSKMTERYAHVADNPVLEASRKTGAAIGAALSAGKSGRAKKGVG